MPIYLHAGVGIGSYPVKVNFTFLLLTAFVLDSGFGVVGIVIWTSVVFLSILLHEMERWRPGRGRVEASWIGLTVAGKTAIWTFRGYILFPLILLFFAVNDFARVTGKRVPFES